MCVTLLVITYYLTLQQLGTLYCYVWMEIKPNCMHFDIFTPGLSKITISIMT